MGLYFWTFVIIDNQFESFGCWWDGEKSAINGYGGFTGLEGCYELAVSRGYDFFAIQHGGECYTSATAGKTYKIYGPAYGCCSEDGTGGIRCQEVYKIELIS